MSTDNNGGTSRRNFLKTSVISALGLSIAAPVVANELVKGTGKKRKYSTFALSKKEYNTIDDAYEISPDYKRMDQRDSRLLRDFWDPTVKDKGVVLSFAAKALHLVPNPNDGTPGYTKADQALSKASWGGHDAGTAGMSALGIHNKGPLNDWSTLQPKVEKKVKFENLDEANQIVKRASNFLGADLVGIAPYDERWVYSKWYDAYDKLYQRGPAIHSDANLPFQPKSVIAVAFEMDYDALKTPGALSDSAVGLEYSHMAETTHKIAVFLNELGYKAIPAGNDVGLSIPVAIQAGLGEQSRMGTLITEKYGSRVRLAKVYTDMELVPDKPIRFGVEEFCEKCMKCADLCPSKAISKDKKPSWEPKTTASASSHPGVKKWFQDSEKCVSEWEKTGVGCSVCLTVCPYNKLDTWVHDISKIAVGIPIGRDIARQMDEAFGYGSINAENADKFWNKEIND